MVRTGGWNPAATWLHVDETSTESVAGTLAGHSVLGVIFG